MHKPEEMELRYRHQHSKIPVFAHDLRLGGGRACQSFLINMPLPPSHPPTSTHPPTSKVSFLHVPHALQLSHFPLPKDVPPPYSYICLPTSQPFPVPTSQPFPVPTPCTVARTTSWNTWSSSSQGGREGKNIGTAEKRVALKSAPFFWARGKDDQAGLARQGGWSWGTLACTKTAILNGLVVHTPALL